MHEDQKPTLKKGYQVMSFLQTRRSQIEIADTMNSHESSISREIRRNSFRGKYDPLDAQGTATARRKFAKITTKKL